MSRGVLSVLFALSMILGLACAGRGGGPARCPGEGWCGPAEVAERMAEAAAGSTLTCPIHVESAYAKKPPAAAEGGTEGESAAPPAEAGTLPPGVPEGAHGTLDEKRTRQLRADGDANTCCYTWVAPCPG
ncbi:hypothetical protein SAMN02745121_06719 [Nannocystis exedens]|uniref:Uncharacterized protein n=1 Tax=Nannocystis exedens TaxID=54 RepID=A0A1I2FN06_9BACT|nr:hypothetical protein [Nannocystis exedens]PCC74461.1 hypothetical protein NAEX_07557 [Nannocystis exedens]SFF06189.1 hypothetical protein SAMN02745121_06719 [Nannocystis exedens]